jgi:hypothetical protein
MEIKLEHPELWLDLVVLVPPVVDQTQVVIEDLQ